MTDEIRYICCNYEIIQRIDLDNFTFRSLQTRCFLTRIFKIYHFFILLGFKFTTTVITIHYE